MELEINSKKKCAQQKQNARSPKSVRILVAISRILLLLGIVGGGSYALVNWFSPNFSMVNVNGVPQKDISWIVISTSFIVAPCLIFSVCLKALAKNLASSNNKCHIDKSLVNK